MKTTTWPQVKRYVGGHLARIAMPIGGIGTGTVSLGGRGDLRDWELANRPAKGFIPRRTCFTVWAKQAGRDPVARICEGPLPLDLYEGSSGAIAPNHGLPRFSKCEFRAAYPLGQVLLSDAGVPIDVRLEAFNPLIPADEEASGIPVAVLRFVLSNKTNKPVEAAVCGNLENFIGSDGTLSAAGGGNLNEFRQDGPVRGIFMSAPELDKTSPAWGTMALTTIEKSGVSYRTDWARPEWNTDLLDYWDDFLADGKLEDRVKGAGRAPMASLAVKTRLGPKASKTITFLLTWHYPNRMSWTPKDPTADTGVKKHATDYVGDLEVSDLVPFGGPFKSLGLPPQGTSFYRRTFAEPFINLHGELSAATEGAVMYVRTRIRCGEPMMLNALFGYDGPVKLWIDCQEQFCDPHGTTPSAPDRGRAAFLAAAGEHEVIAAIEAARGQSWGMYLRFERPGGGTLPQIEQDQNQAVNECVGNYYATQYADAWDVARQTAPRLAPLEQRTVQFVQAFCDSDLPAVVKEAALFNVSTLRTQTCFRTADGLFFGWEGCGDRVGSCHGSCTHVWNYEQSTPFLFGKLARLMRTVEFEHATGADGMMSFRTNLPLARAHDFPVAAADGQLGCLMKLYREWQLSGDEQMLQQLWPKARKALEFCWLEGGWDGDCDGVMEGCQHNTMDVEYYGPNPQMQIWYLGALHCAEQMAQHMGENDFAAKCRALYENGRTYADEQLFNGEYYEHKVQRPADDSKVLSSIRTRKPGPDEADEYKYQIASGCLIDQLIGQMLADVCGLGSLVDERHIRKTLHSVVKFNRRSNMGGHFNHMRSYALADETALLMASYPRGRRPRVPFPYYTEVMTGFEYTVAVGLMRHGDTAEGLRIIRDIRNRYDGQKRSPFNEAECGHHYARAMAAWGAVLAMTGFQYSAPQRTITFAAARKASWFWSSGDAWGTFTQTKVAGGTAVEFKVLGGQIAVDRIVLRGAGEVLLSTTRQLKAGHSVRATTPPAKCRAAQRPCSA